MFSNLPSFVVPIVIVLGSLCLGVLQLIRVRSEEPEKSTVKLKRFAIAKFVLCMFAGFIFLVGVTRLGLSIVGLERIHFASQLVTNLVNLTDPARNQIVLVGSSQTAQGIDGAQLEKELRQGGHDFQIIQLSVPALFNIESDYLLERYLARSPHRPTAIFIDVGFDSEYLPAIDQRRNGGAVAASDWPHTIQRIKRVWRRYREDIKLSGFSKPAQTLKYGFEFFAETIDAIDFLTCNLTYCAELLQLDPNVPGQYTVGTQLLYGHAPYAKASEMRTRAELACGTGSPVIPADLMEPSVGFRRWQVQKYLGLGIPIVGFFYPPNLDIGKSCFETRFCERVSPHSCLLLNGTHLLDGLDNYERWYDSHHVNNLGVPILTSALAIDIANLIERRSALVR